MVIAARVAVRKFAHHSLHVMPGLSRPKDGVASLAYDPGIHELVRQGQSCELNFAAAWSWMAGSSPAMTAEITVQAKWETL
jgi:hypothetical protein